MTLYDAFHEQRDNEEPLFVMFDGLSVPLFVEYFERRGQRGALMRFADIDTPERATELVGEEIFVCGAQKEADAADELTFDDLVGYRFIIAGETLHGSVAAFIDSEMNPLLQLDAAGRELLIPAADEFIESLDTDARTISFILPEGLLELYIDGE